MLGKETLIYSVITALCLLFFSSLPASADEGTYCDDPAVWLDWHEQATKQKGNLDFQTLHALWIGLCAKVHAGTLTADEADVLFERARGTLIQRQQEQKDKQRGPSL